MNNFSNINDKSINGYFSVLNYGGFLTRFFVTYKLGSIYYNKYSGIFPIGESRKIIVPRSSTDIEFFVQIQSFPFVWAGIFRQLYDTVDQRCYLAYGLSFLPYLISVPCNSPRFI